MRTPKNNEDKNNEDTHEQAKKENKDIHVMSLVD